MNEHEFLKAVEKEIAEFEGKDIRAWPIPTQQRYWIYLYVKLENEKYELIIEPCKEIKKRKNRIECLLKVLKDEKQKIDGSFAVDFTKHGKELLQEFDFKVPSIIEKLEALIEYEKNLFELENLKKSKNVKAGLGRETQKIDPDKIYSVKEAAELYNCDERSILNYIHGGKNHKEDGLISLEAEKSKISKKFEIKGSDLIRFKEKFQEKVE